MNNFASIPNVAYGSSMHGAANADAFIPILIGVAVAAGIAAAIAVQ